MVMEAIVSKVTFSGHALKVRRTMADRNQIQLADAVGVSPGTVRDWEGERFSPSVAMLCRLVTALDCKIGDLFEDSRS
jgi:DNA-binding XRE family transcriptional regulator